MHDDFLFCFVLFCQRCRRLQSLCCVSLCKGENQATSNDTDWSQLATVVCYLFNLLIVLTNAKPVVIALRLELTQVCKLLILGRAGSLVD